MGDVVAYWIWGLLMTHSCTPVSPNDLSTWNPGWKEIFNSDCEAHSLRHMTHMNLSFLTMFTDESVVYLNAGRWVWVGLRSHWSSSLKTRSQWSILASTTQKGWRTPRVERGNPFKSTYRYGYSLLHTGQETDLNLEEGAGEVQHSKIISEPGSVRDQRRVWGDKLQTPDWRPCLLILGACKIKRVDFLFLFFGYSS